MQYARVFLAALAVVMLLSSTSIMAEESQPEGLGSPDGRHSVVILDRALSGADPHNGFFTLVVRRGGKSLARYPTIGYLTDAFWSADGKYVAVNNRRGNSGDYLWVFRLGDGHAVRMPVDARAERHPGTAYGKYMENLLRPVRSQLPALATDELRKLFTFAKGWTESGDLLVKTNLAFRNLPEGQIAVLLQTFRVTGGKLVLVDEKAEIAPWPPKT